MNYGFVKKERKNQFNVNVKAISSVLKTCDWILASKCDSIQHTNGLNWAIQSDRKHTGNRKYLCQKQSDLLRGNKKCAKKTALQEDKDPGNDGGSFAVSASRYKTQGSQQIPSRV